MSEAWDEAGWSALERELDAWRRAGRVASFWWRDDDAGRPAESFDRLLALAARGAVPLGLAVVPAWLASDVASAIRAAPASVAVLQHGWAHANHEVAPPPGERKVRPAECGGARAVEVVLAEARAGLTRLRAAVGARAVPVFVPPWNRIAPAARAALPGAGYRALSAFGPRSPARRDPNLQDLHCHVDPILWREGKRFAGPAATLDRLRAHLADRRTARADPDEPTGLLTHHRDLSPAGWSFLEELLARLAGHPAAAFPPVPALIGSPPA